MSMKIKRIIHGKEVEIELTQNEIAEAYLQHEHYCDCESVRRDLNSGRYEQFEGLSDKAREVAVHEIAYMARHQMNKYGYSRLAAIDFGRQEYVNKHLNQA